MKIGWLLYDDKHGTVEFHTEYFGFSGCWVQIVYTEVIQ